MTEASPATTNAPHPLKLELEQRGFVMARIAVRMGVTYGWLYRRLTGQSPMAPDDELKLRQAMEPNDLAESDPDHPLPPAA